MTARLSVFLEGKELELLTKREGQDARRQQQTLPVVLADKYVLQERIGSGGQSCVYRARDRKLEKDWAVKEICLEKSCLAARKERLLAECHVLKNLDCPYFPRIVDIIEKQEAVYLVMDFVEGETLEACLARAGALPEEEAVRLGILLTQALSFLHGARPQVLYLDLKPSNIILTGDGGLKLVDFGSVLIEGQKKESYLTGTDGYAAPEQLRGQATVRSDVYSLGRTLAAMVLGREACFPGTERLRSLDAALSLELEEVIGICLRQDPSERYASMEEVHKALEDACRPGRKKSFGKCKRAGSRKRAGNGSARRWNRRVCYRQEKNILLTDKKGQYLLGPFLTLK